MEIRGVTQFVLTMTEQRGQILSTKQEDNRAGMKDGQQGISLFVTVYKLLHMKIRITVFTLNIHTPLIRLLPRAA